jgi:hypothetical protein
VRVSSEDAEAVRAHPADVLGRYGVVTLNGGEPYRKDPALLEFRVDLVPDGRVGEAAEALRAEAPGGWSVSRGDEWYWQRGKGPAFLHRGMESADMQWSEAADLPAFTSGDVVRIVDCPAARKYGLVGVEAEVGGYCDPQPDDEYWVYSVFPSGWDQIILLDEPDLAPTGRRANTAEQTSMSVISVRPDGRITGAWSQLRKQ